MDIVHDLKKLRKKWRQQANVDAKIANGVDSQLTLEKLHGMISVGDSYADQLDQIIKKYEDGFFMVECWINKKSFGWNKALSVKPDERANCVDGEGCWAQYKFTSKALAYKFITKIRKDHKEIELRFFKKLM